MNAYADGAMAPHVVIRIGAARIGIPADCVERALSAPEQYTPLPRRHGALLGMLAVDDQPVPVIDIGCWVALAGAGQAGEPARLRRVVLLRSGARMAAVQVDALEPLTALPAKAIVRLCHDNDADQLFHSAAMLPDSGEMLALLSVDNLFDLAHSWCVAAGVNADASAGAQAAAIAAAPSETWALVDACGQRLALRAEHVAEVTPMPEMERCFGGSGVSLCQWRGGHLAVLPVARLLDVGGAAAPAPLLAVLRMGDLSLGLPIQQVCELRQLPADASGVVNDTAGRMPCLTISTDDGDTLRLVDTAALFAMHPEAGLNMETQAQPADNRRRNEVTYVVVDAGGKLALPIDAFEEVLHAAPEDCGATLNWRGCAIAVHDLRQPVGLAARRGKVALVVLRTETVPVALAVDQVISMITPGSAEITRMRRAGETVDLLILDDDSGSSTYRVADPASLFKHSA